MLAFSHFHINQLLGIGQMSSEVTIAHQTSNYRLNFEDLLNLIQFMYHTVAHHFYCGLWVSIFFTWVWQS